MFERFSKGSKGFNGSAFLTQQEINTPVTEHGRWKPNMPYLKSFILPSDAFWYHLCVIFILWFGLILPYIIYMGCHIYFRSAVIWNPFFPAKVCRLPWAPGTRVGRHWPAARLPHPRCLWMELEVVGTGPPKAAPKRQKKKHVFFKTSQDEYLRMHRSRLTRLTENCAMHLHASCVMYLSCHSACSKHSFHASNSNSSSDSTWQVQSD